MTEGRNPAVVAGLLSGLVLVAEPASAYALTANEIRQRLLVQSLQALEWDLLRLQSFLVRPW